MVRPAATIVAFDADQLVVTVPAAGRYVVRIATSPWLSVLETAGVPSPAACLTTLATDDPDGHPYADNWVVLHAPEAGTYRITAPYKLPRGTPCPR
jgi:hypothetical protein